MLKDDVRISIGPIVRVVIIAVAVYLVLSLLLCVPPTRKGDPCLSQLKQISLAMKQYANVNDGECPEELSVLYPEYVFSGGLFKCPSSRHDVLEKGSIQEIRRSIDKSGSYRIVRGVDENSPPDWIFVYCKVLHRDRTRKVLYVDGSAEILSEKGFDGKLEKQKKLMKEVRRTDD